MVTPVRHLPTPKAAEADDLFDYAHVRHVIGSVFRGVRRHRLLTAGVFLAIAGLGIGWMIIAPRTYHVEAKLLASRSQLIRSLGNPRASGSPFEDPTRAAEETVFARNNLLSLIKQTNLLESLEQTRSLPARVRDAAMELVLGPMSAEDKLDALVGLLEKRLKVTTDSQTVIIAIDWPDAQAAYQIVETAQQNFLEARHVSEMTAISEALSILELHAATQQKAVSEALLELEHVRELRRDGASALPPAAWSEGPTTPVQSATPTKRAEPTAAGLANEQELAQLKYLYHSKRRALSDLEEFRAKRLLELNALLVEQRIQYADKHPAIVDTMQRIAAMSEASPQMVQVRAEVADLLGEYTRKGGQNPESLAEPTRRSDSNRRTSSMSATQSATPVTTADLADDPEVEFARNKLRVASATYEELTMRIDGARIEQDTARAAFKYRYSIIRPATLPKKPTSPKLEMLLAASLALAFFLALISGAVLDRWRGLIVEPWQVTSELGLPVLSEVKAA